MPANIHTSTRGNTLTVRVSGPLDHRIASSLFSRFLSAKSTYDKLIIDLTGVDEVFDAGLAALRLLRNRAREAGKRLAVVSWRREGVLAHPPALREGAYAPVPPVMAGHPLCPMPPYAANALSAGRLHASRQAATRPTHSGESPWRSYPRAPVACQPSVA
jgi:ABC-type transporter Mla MlaB component